MTGHMTGDATDHMTGDATGHMTGDATGHMTDDATDDVTGDVTREETDEMTGDATEDGAVASAPGVPVLRQVVLDTTDARGLAEFYRELFGLAYRPGDEQPPAGTDDERGRDWLVLRSPAGGPGLAFQQVERQPASTWPDDAVPQMLHLDSTVASVEDLRAAQRRALALGATVLLDRTDDEEEPLWVLADPAGHPFCIFVAPALP